jgi:signal transduction histidine kinase
VNSYQEEIQILIAEDDYLVSEMIKGVLFELGYTVAGEAADGCEAVKLAQQLRPDVILMDLEMPCMSGLEATRQIQKICPTPVVVLTAYNQIELVEEASAAGVGAYLVKPPNMDELERAVMIARARFGDMMKLHLLNAELQARNMELDAFAHTVAHDLRDPLALITGYIGLLKEQCVSMPDEIQGYLNLITRNSLKMSSIIEELQLLAGLRTIQVQIEPLHMARIVAEAQQRLRHLIEEKKAQLLYPTDWPVAVGYAPWIEEVWANYLSNGLKYGGSPPRLQLGATTRSDGMVRFWVRDNGPGLSPEAQKRLFSPFTRLDQVRTKGYGLGLSIVQRIITKLGGEVGVDSEVGQGSIFSFTLPAHQPSATNHFSRG